MASAALGGRSLSQHSQLGRNSSMQASLVARRIFADEQERARSVLNAREHARRTQRAKDPRPLYDLDAVDFHTLGALARGIADALVGLDRLDTGTPERAGVEIDVAAAAVGHHKAKALLVVEKLDLAFDHGAGRAVVAMSAIAAAAKTIAPTAETVAAATEAVAATAEAIAATAKAITAAKVAARTAAWRFRRGSIDAVHRHDLQAALAVG